jgi:hypothetical protein
MEWRSWRWLELREDRVVLQAVDEAGWQRLEREAEILGRLAPALGDMVPHVVLRDPAQRRQERTRYHGLGGVREVERLVFGVEPLPCAAERYEMDCPLTPQGTRLASDLGAALARFHRADAAGLPQRP